MFVDRQTLPPLHIEAAAAHYIQTRGGHILLRRSPRHGCCGGRVFLPVVDLGRPASADDYLTLEQDGVRIHIERPLVFSWRGPLTIGFTQLWGWGKLWVEGGAATM